jgi:hypothetical protein
MHVRLPAAPGPARLTGMARFVRRPRAIGNCLGGDQTEGKKSKGEWWRQESRRCCLCLAELASLVKLVKDSDDEVRPRPCLVSRWDGAASPCCWLLSCCFLPTRFLLSGAAPFFLCCFGSDLSPPRLSARLASCSFAPGGWRCWSWRGLCLRRQRCRWLRDKRHRRVGRVCSGRRRDPRSG